MKTLTLLTSEDLPSICCALVDGGIDSESEDIEHPRDSSASMHTEVSRKEGFDPDLKYC